MGGYLLFISDGYGPYFQGETFRLLKGIKMWGQACNIAKESK